MTATDFKQPAFVRTLPSDALPPPLAMTGALGWVRANLLSGPFNIAMTILVILLIVWIVPPLLKFLLIDATWSGTDREACLATEARPEIGA
ncbi:MAG TPA: amino acid ABC transporter permease, partial [Xanthobacteraceae bacterium]|nr:amino acid ABC transporter permease [Xanthobacteraceae bacterium]